MRRRWPALVRKFLLCDLIFRLGARTPKISRLRPSIPPAEVKYEVEDIRSVVWLPQAHAISLATALAIAACSCSEELYGSLLSPACSTLADWIRLSQMIRELRRCAGFRAFLRARLGAWPYPGSDQQPYV